MCYNTVSCNLIRRGGSDPWEGRPTGKSAIETTGEFTMSHGIDNSAGKASTGEQSGTRALDDLFEQLLTISRQALAQGRYSTAYHALAAALHWALADEDDQRLLIVGKLSAEQLDWIDHHAPGYEHSSHSAAHRGNHSSIFKQLERQANTSALVIRQNRRHGIPIIR
jgi:hypothetical protein